jgi:anaerobic magnesium-protoporphyrin IX monomethyl ester cyclase
MEKGITIDQVRIATKKLKANGIKPCFFIQFGYLDERADDIKKTIDLINELMPHDIGVSVSYPLPGTKFYEKVKGDLERKANWKHSDDLDMMFENTYTPEFYRQLHRYVHKKFRKRRAADELQRLFRRPLESGPRQWKRALSYFYYVPAAFLERRRLKVIDHEAAERL